MENGTQILIFKTNVGIIDKNDLLLKLQAHEFIQEVSLDTEDCDRVLRVVVKQTPAEKIISIVGAEGFQCMELD